MTTVSRVETSLANTQGAAVSTVVELDDVTFGYDETPVVQNVNLRVEQGESAVLVGPNGGGKTTLFRLMLGLLAPDAGRVRVFGESPERARTRIGYVPQHMLFDPQFPIRVADVAAMGCLQPLYRLTRSASRERERVTAALEAVGLAGFDRRWFRDLSAGQRQRVLIARALATGPELLLLDEPTASADVHALDAILALLDRLKSEMTILVVSHDTDVVSRFLDKVVCVNRTVHIHPTAGVIDNDLMRHIVGYSFSTGAGP